MYRCNGLVEDPFESTNADNEPQLIEYFVPPPYFATVLGSTGEPQSHIVLAPRGSGKSAQRRMIEERAASGEFLCLTYDKFDQPAGFKAEAATLSYHLKQICRLLLLGILLKLDDEPGFVDFIDKRQRALLKTSTMKLLGSISAAEYEYAIRAIKTFGDKAAEFWKKYGGPVAVGIQMLLKRAGLDAVDVPSAPAEEAKRDDGLPYVFEQLVNIARELLFESVYVLVDKVDEASITVSSQKTFDLIRPLLTDLPTLETDGAAFKFFLWDQIEDSYRQSGARADRIPILKLNWTMDELSLMLSKRLLTYSHGRISSLNSLLEDSCDIDLHRLVAYLAMGSPRDMIRVCKRVVNEQTRIDSGATVLSERTVWQGIRVFSEDIVQERFARYVPDLKKVGKPTFTINYVASEVFHIQAQSARNKIGGWMSARIVDKIGEVENPPNRPLHLYGITDLRVLIATMVAADVPVVLGNYALVCPYCAGLVISAEMIIDCTNCGTRFTLDQGRSLHDVCTNDHAKP